MNTDSYNYAGGGTCTVNRRMEMKGFAALSGTIAPAVLVEIAFIDSTRDAQLLVERENDFARCH